MTSATHAENSELDAAAVADAATRLAVLQRLTGLGMRLAEEICERAVNSPYHPEPRHEPGRAFANISRAVRLTVVLQERVEAKLIALRKGETLPVDRSAAAGASRVDGARSTPAAPAPHDDVDDVEGADPRPETFREREGERFDALLCGPFDDCVAAIRSDLGLAPDEDLPSDEADIEVGSRSALGGAATGLTASASPVKARALHPVDSG